MVNKIKNFDGKILATLDTHQNHYMETAEGRKLPVPHCIRYHFINLRLFSNHINLAHLHRIQGRLVALRISR